MLTGVFIPVLLFAIITGTFDVQALLINNNSSTGEVCFECVFLNGSTANGCLIEYECNTTTGYTNGDLTIYSKGGVAGSCSHFTFSCLYSVSVYDIESDGTVDTSTPAYHTHTSIIGVCSPSILTTTTTLYTPTITCTNLVIITASTTDHTEGTIH